MIICKNICKSYGAQEVFKSFSYRFENTGFYLLLGESGSGKTTLLNILSGFLSFDSGLMEVDGISYDHSVSRDRMQEETDYITQDTFFVDFLTVTDNLRMITEDENRIKSVLARFGLEKIEGQYPSSLSGGERQRLAIVRSLLRGKKVLFLDEPTAALDEENKKAVFDLLGQLGKDILIICSTHDEEAVDYADNIIRIDKEQNADPVSIISVETEGRKATQHMTNPHSGIPLYCFIKKWFSSPKRNSKSVFLFGIFLTLSMCLCCLADTPQNKMDSNMEYVYRINMCMLSTQGENAVSYDELCSDDDIEAVVVDYGSVIPMDDNAGTVLQELPDCEVQVPALPYDEKLFRLSGRIKYGTYFTDINQVILTMEEASAFSPGNPERFSDYLNSDIYYQHTEGNLIYIPYGMMQKQYAPSECIYGGVRMFMAYYPGLFNDMKTIQNVRNAFYGGDINIFDRDISEAQGVLDNISMIFAAVFAVCFLIACIFMGSQIQIELFYRKRELGYLQIFGLNKKRIMKIIYTGYMTGILTAIVPAVAVYALVIAAYRVIKGHFIICNPLYFILIIAVITGFYSVAVLLTARKFLKKDIISLVS